MDVRRIVYNILLIALTVHLSSLTAQYIRKDFPPKCFEISQKMVDKAGGTLQLKEAGYYLLLGDITGILVLDHDDIELDLGSYCVSSSKGEDKTSPVIAAQGLTNISIFNGSVVYTSVSNQQAGIAITACSNVSISDISFKNITTTALLIEAQSIGTAPDFEVVNPSTRISVSNCGFTEGNRALVLRGCQYGSIKTCTMNGNNNTLSSVVGIECCQCITAESIEVCKNTKAVPNQGEGPLGHHGPEIAAFSILASTDITLDNCATSNNTSNKTMAGLYIGAEGTEGNLKSSKNIQVLNHTSNNNRIGRLNADKNELILYGIFSYSTVNAQFTGCQTNENSLSSANTTYYTIYGDTAYGLALTGSSSPIVVSKHQSNSNSTSGLEANTIAICVNGTSEKTVTLIMEDTEASDNHATGLIRGFDFTYVKNGKIASCQACQNIGGSGKKDLPHYSAVGFNSIKLQNILFQDCLASTNKTLASQAYSYGFSLESATNSILIRCKASNDADKKSLAAYGIKGTKIERCIFKNCVLTQNKTYGLRLEFTNYCSIIESIAQENGVGFSEFDGYTNVYYDCTAEKNKTNYSGIDNKNIVSYPKSTDSLVNPPSQCIL